MLRFSKKYLPIVAVRKMYRSLVEPYFRYSCPVWGAAGINAINRLQKFQNRAARIVTNSAYDAFALPIIRKLGWPIISYHIISYHIISYHIISYHIISYHIISYHIIS